MRILNILMCLSLCLSADTIKCNHLINLATDEVIEINSTVVANGKSAKITIDGVGTFHYIYDFKTPVGLIVYTGTDNSGYLGYSKLNPSTIVLGEIAGVSGCHKVK